MQPSVEQLSEALKPIVRRGLPVVPDAADQVLLELRCVNARAADDDLVSRCAALDELLRDILEEGTSGEATAARALFGLLPSLTRTNLTTRRIAAASILNYDLDHYRKHVEPATREAAAYELVRVELRYRRRPRIAVAPLRIDMPDSSQDLECIERGSRLWALAYGEYAELLAALNAGGEDQPDTRHHQHLALWHHVRLLTAVAEYMAHYGRLLIVDGEPIEAERLLTVLGRPDPFTQEEVVHLRALTMASTDEQDFIERLITTPEGRRLRGKWCRWCGTPQVLPRPERASARPTENFPPLVAARDERCSAHCLGKQFDNTGPERHG